MTVLVIDAGTSGVRAVVVRADGSVAAEVHVEVLPSSPASGMVELDAVATADAARTTATAVLDRVGTVDAVGITNQRATTIVWDARTGEPTGPGLGWQDLRTVGRCLGLRPDGVRLAPNMSATKAEWLVQHTDVPAEHLRIGTVDSWLAWVLSDGSVHVTDASNALVTGLYDPATRGWSGALLELLGIPPTAMASVGDSSGHLATATALPGAPPITALIGDQQASLAGQGCTSPGDAKLTLGTGGMLDICMGAEPGPSPQHGTFPMVAWRLDGVDTWAREAVMLAAGSCVEWLRDGLGLIDDVASSEAVAASVPDAGDVMFVPALSGLGTPMWDHGARGLLVGITRGTARGPPRPGRPRRRRPHRRRPPRRRRSRHRPGRGRAARRRWDERQPRRAPGARRRHRSTGRPIEPARGHGHRRRVPRRGRRRRLAPPRRRLRDRRAGRAHRTKRRVRPGPLRRCGRPWRGLDPRAQQPRPVSPVHSRGATRGSRPVPGTLPDRRRFLRRAGVGGALVAVGPVLVPAARFLAPAAAQTGADAALAAFAESVELVAVTAYEPGLELLSEDMAMLLQTFVSHHEEHAEAFAAVAGNAATGRPNAALLAALTPAIEAFSTQNEVLRFARDLENQLSVTCGHLLTLVEDADAVSAVATILPVESSHSATISFELDEGPEAWFPFGPLEATDIALGLDPTAFPLGAS